LVGDPVLGVVGQAQVAKGGAVGSDEVRGHYGPSLDYLEPVLRDATTAPDLPTAPVSVPKKKPKPTLRLGLTIVGEVNALVTDDYVRSTAAVIADDASGKAFCPPASIIKTYCRLNGATFAPLPRGRQQPVRGRRVGPAARQVTALADQAGQKLLKVVKASSEARAIRHHHSIERQTAPRPATALLGADDVAAGAGDRIDEAVQHRKYWLEPGGCIATEGP
jgi:hypothetical protein